MNVGTGTLILSYFLFLFSVGFHQVCLKSLGALIILVLHFNFPNDRVYHYLVCLFLCLSACLFQCLPLAFNLSCSFSGVHCTVLMFNTIHIPLLKHQQLTSTWQTDDLELRYPHQGHRLFHKHISPSHGEYPLGNQTWQTKWIWPEEETCVYQYHYTTKTELSFHCCHFHSVSFLGTMCSDKAGICFHSKSFIYVQVYMWACYILLDNCV